MRTRLLTFDLWFEVFIWTDFPFLRSVITCFRCGSVGSSLDLDSCCAISDSYCLCYESASRLLLNLSLWRFYQNILKAYSIYIAVKPHTTMKNILEHPKDRGKVWSDIQNTLWELWSCLNWRHGSTLRRRVKEHHKLVDCSITGVFSRAKNAIAASICNKYTITAHVCNENRVVV